MKQLSTHIPMGYELTFTTDAITSGSYVRFAPGGTRYTPSAMVVSTSYTVGPFNEPRDYRFDYAGTDLSLTLAYSGVFTGADDTDTVKVTDDVTALTPLAEVNVADIDVDATGTEIATAVNGILAILVAAGLMEAAE